MIEAYKNELEQSPLERLRWLVCRYLGVFPYGEICDEDIIKCGLHMLIDSERS